MASSTVSRSQSALSLRSSLLTRLGSLPFPAFVEISRRLLLSLDYEDVRPVIARRGKKGKNRSGGFDLEGWVKVGATRRRVIAQVKQVPPDAKVHQRTVDEIRGAALRTGATEALLLTTGTFSYVVQEQLERQRWANAAGVTSLVPVHCLDGSHLADHLIAQNIGLSKDSAGKEPRLDGDFFDDLAARSRNHPSPGKNASTEMPETPARSARRARRTDRHTSAAMTLPGRQVSIHLFVPLAGESNTD